ncbi:hypothetical protein J6590_060326 [Homalodisca vitripennis]|nr:hypothetical protein J6590_060326 [Homalodisca vitripennis]
MQQCRMMLTVKSFGEFEKYAYHMFSSLQAIDNSMNKFSYGIDGRLVFPKPEIFRTENFEAVKEFFKLIEEHFFKNFVRNWKDGNWKQKFMTFIMTLSMAVLDEAVNRVGEFTDQSKRKKARISRSRWVRGLL